MADEWRDISLGDFLALQRGHDLTEPDRRAGCVPVIGSAGKNGFHDTVLAKGPGIVIGRSGASFGQVHFSKEDFWPHNTGLYVTDFKGNDPLFAFYLLKRIDFDRFNSGSAQPSLNRNFIYPIPIRVPAPSEQKAIASILGALDDKIELNRRMNATLEAMARALFKSWFIDFDPVRAKLDGRQPEGMDESTAALFPDSFQESSLGPIPHGWTADTIKNRASNIQYGFTQSATKEPVGPHFLRITDISGGRIDWASVPFCQATDEEREKYRITDGDIFIARTGASTGDNIYAVEPPPAVFASYLIRLQFRSLGLGRLVGEFIRTPDYASHVAGNIGGSAQPNASAQTLAGAAMVFPTEDIADAFYRTFRPLDLIRAANDRESCTLATLRDTLLPKLLSGELSVATTNA